MTLAEVVKEECLKAGVSIKNEDIEHVIWGETGYPCFWPDINKTPEENFRRQVREWAEKQPKEKQ